MSKKRATDTRDREYFRSDRLLCEKGLWYFITREKTLEGPFATRRIAEQNLQTFITLSRLSSGFEAELMPLEGAAPKSAKRTAHPQRWVTDPFHRHFGMATSRG